MDSFDHQLQVRASMDAIELRMINAVGNCVATFVVPRYDALQVARDIVYLVDGSLIKGTRADGSIKWNTSSRFHQLYAEVLRG